MNHDPEAWRTLGAAIRIDREAQGLTREQVVERLAERGVKVSARTIGSIETGVAPRKGLKPPSLERVVSALGWLPGWADRILDGDPVESVLAERSAPDSDSISPRERVLELVPAVYAFSRAAVAAGASSDLRDSFDDLAQRLLASITSGSRPLERSTYGLVSYRPHALGEGVPGDDAERIAGAISRRPR